MERLSEDAIAIFLCGDVMTGRGIDQVLPHPGSPVLYEGFVRDARDYVRLAEAAHGTIPRATDFGYVWGDSLEELRQAGIDVRIINLETSITRGGAPWPDKGIHYRMHPENTGVLTAAGIDCCCLANNHVLDWGREGLVETLQTLDAAGIAHPGAGWDEEEAAAPAVLDLPARGRVLVFSLGCVSSGIPIEWGAARGRSGVSLLTDLSAETARRLGDEILRIRRPGDVVIASLHWGGNWGYRIPEEHARFAHRLIEDGVDVVHGHSSHHVRALEIYRDRLILYGCGDFINDYEGIGGYEEYRADLRLMYLLRLDSRAGRLLDVRLVPMQARRFRLRRASEADTRWLCELLDRLAAPFGTRVRRDGERSLTLQWG